jgi:hypothetical protein
MCGRCIYSLKVQSHQILCFILWYIKLNQSFLYEADGVQTVLLIVIVDGILKFVIKLLHENSH